MAMLLWQLAPVTKSLLLALLLVGFVMVDLYHRRNIKVVQNKKTAVNFWQKHLARIDGDWVGSGTSGSQFAPKMHPYGSGGLGLFGEGSLYEYLCFASTWSGQETLAKWLLEKEPPAAVIRRQTSIKELSGLLDFRESLAVSGDASKSKGARFHLDDWLSKADRFAAKSLRTWTWIAISMAGAVLALPYLAYWNTAALVLIPLLCLLHAYLRSKMKAPVEAILSPLSRSRAEMSAIANILESVGQQSFQSPDLKELQALVSDGGRSAKAIRSFHRLLSSMENQLNPLIAIFCYMLLWDVIHALLLEAWRMRHRAQLQRWTKGLGEIEALLALSTVGVIEDDHCYPTLSQTGDIKVGFENLKNPLIPCRQRVGNDLTITDRKSFCIISGSNMAGKSTFLRSIALNIILAQSGAPVLASSFVLGNIQLGASVSTHDSISEGVSRFMAEITQIASFLSADSNSFFLIDEVFSGTNSFARITAVEQILKQFLPKSYSGIITTHDLEITQMSERFSDKVRNYHFRDDVSSETGLSFDYKLRSGVVPHSNALKLMKMVGLPVEDHLTKTEGQAGKTTDSP